MLPLTSMRHLQTENRDLQVHNRDLYPICTKPLLLRSRGLWQGAVGARATGGFSGVAQLAIASEALPGRPGRAFSWEECSEGAVAPGRSGRLPSVAEATVQGTTHPHPERPALDGRLSARLPRSTYSPSANFLLEAAGKVGIDLPELSAEIPEPLSAHRPNDSSTVGARGPGYRHQNHRAIPDFPSRWRSGRSIRWSDSDRSQRPHDRPLRSHLGQLHRGQPGSWRVVGLDPATLDQIIQWVEGKVDLP